MKLYLAGSWLRRDEIRGYADDLKKFGVEITSRWLYTHGNMPDYQAALEDLEDIRKADMLVLFTQDSSAGYTTGGRHFESGYAWAKGMPMFIVGPRENVFHSLVAGSEVFANYEQLKNVFQYVKT